MLGDNSVSIVSILFTQNDQVAVVTYENGLVSAYDVRGGFNWLGDVEKEVPRAGGFNISGNGARIIERHDSHVDPYSISS